MSNILEVKDLKVAYGGIEAVRGISFEVPEGEVVTLIGAFFLGVIAVFPILYSGITNINVSLGSTSIIIVVGVALDTMRQLESRLTMRHHKGFLE